MSGLGSAGVFGRPRVLVTGASGFIGGRAAERLCDRGYRVRAVYRRSSLPSHLLRLAERGAELRRFDLSNDTAVDELTDGCDYIVHAAARVLDYGRHRAFVSANVDATKRLVDSALDGTCSKFLFVGSVSVHGFGGHRGTTERGPYYRLRSSYPITKMYAENIVRAAHGRGMNVVVVRPGLVYGPGDTTTLAPFFRLLESRDLPWLAGFEHLNCPIYISDLVDGIVLALESDRANGRVYNLTSGEAVTLAEAVRRAAELLDAPLPQLRIPSTAAKFLASVAESASALTGYRIRPPLTRYLAEQLSRDFHFSPEKARRELGFAPRVGWEEGLAAAVDSYRRRERF